MNLAIQELNRIHRPCYGSEEKSGDGRTCRIRQVEERRQIAGFAVVPNGREQIRLQNGLVGKEKQTMAAFQLGTGIHERLHPRGTGSNGENTKTGNAEAPLVDFLRPGDFVGEKFAMERCLDKVGTINRHGSPVCFEEEICPLNLAALVCIFQGEHTVGNDAEPHAVLHFHPPTERLCFHRQSKLVLDALENLQSLTKRRTKAEVVRDALSVYGYLTRFIREGEHLYVGKSREGARELAITTLENARQT